MENNEINTVASPNGETFVEKQIYKDEEELKKYTMLKIIDTVMNKNNGYRRIKLVHASGHGGQHINHGNSKAQLHFDIDKFYNDFDIPEKSWDDFMKIFGEKNITHDQSTLVLENQETRYASKNKENVLNHLRSLLLELFKDEKERVQTEISNYQKEQNMQDKKKHSEKKARRKKINLQDVE